MAIVAVTSPVLGAIADLAGVRKALSSRSRSCDRGDGVDDDGGAGMLARGFVLGVIGNIGFEAP